MTQPRHRRSAYTVGSGTPARRNAFALSPHLTQTPQCRPRRGVLHERVNPSGRPRPRRMTQSLVRRRNGARSLIGAASPRARARSMARRNSGAPPACRSAGPAGTAATLRPEGPPSRARRSPGRRRPAVAARRNRRPRAVGRGTWDDSRPGITHEGPSEEERAPLLELLFAKRLIGEYAAKQIAVKSHEFVTPFCIEPIGTLALDQHWLAFRHHRCAALTTIDVRIGTPGLDFRRRGLGNVDRFIALEIRVRSYADHNWEFTGRTGTAYNDLNRSARPDLIQIITNVADV